MSELALVRDPVFGLPLTRFEREVWLRILRPKKSWRSEMWRMLKRATTPFGSTSGGAGGTATTTEIGGAGDAYKLANGDWPVWLLPTRDFQSFDKFGSTALAAFPSAGTIGDGILNNGNSMPWTVPKGFNGFIKTLAIQETEGLWVPGTVPPQLVITLLVNGNAPPDYGKIAYSPGLLVAPSPLAGVPIKEFNQVQFNFSNAAITPGGGGDFLAARTQGYYYGKQYEPKQMAF